MSTSEILGGILFGSVGFVAFVYGKKTTSFRLMMLGGALMAFPYFMPGAVWLYAVGTVLTAMIFIFR